MTGSKSGSHTNAQSALEVEKVVITVSDLKISVPFYKEVLGFEEVNTLEFEGNDFQELVGVDNPNLAVKIVELRLGDETIALQEFSGEKQERPIPLDSKSNDLWFQHIAIVVRDMEKAYEKLWNEEVVHISTRPQTLPDYLEAAAGITAFYFQDPDGHVLELIHFPAGKGNPKWQKKSDALFLGIDHTAIAIRRTLPSSEFYENIVGLKIQSQSENYGTEQEHLNQLFGARLLISSLSAKAGIGIEFLDYIAPPGGRPYPENSCPTDAWHWHTVIKVSDIDEMHDKLRDSETDFISKRIITLDTKRQFMVRDPDGHALLMTE